MYKMLICFHCLTLILCLISVESGTIRRPLSRSANTVQIPNSTTLGLTSIETPFPDIKANNSLAKNSMANNGTEYGSENIATNLLDTIGFGQSSKGSKKLKNMKMESRLKSKRNQSITPDTPQQGRRTTTTTTRKPNFEQYDQKKIPFLWLIMIAMELFIIITLVCCWYSYLSFVYLSLIITELF